MNQYTQEAVAREVRRIGKEAEELRNEIVVHQERIAEIENKLIPVLAQKRTQLEDDLHKDGLPTQAL